MRWFVGWPGWWLPTQSILYTEGTTPETMLKETYHGRHYYFDHELGVVPNFRHPGVWDNTVRKPRDNAPRPYANGDHFIRHLVCVFILSLGFFRGLESAYVSALSLMGYLSPYRDSNMAAKEIETWRHRRRCFHRLV